MVSNAADVLTGHTREALIESELPWCLSGVRKENPFFGFLGFPLDQLAFLCHDIGMRKPKG